MDRPAGLRNRTRPRADRIIVSMPITEAALTGVERTFDVDEFIVSKTDLKGRITYANNVFLRVAGYTEAEVLGQPHNMIRHPHMPRCVFRPLVPGRHSAACPRSFGTASKPCDRSVAAVRRPIRNRES